MQCRLTRNMRRRPSALPSQRAIRRFSPLNGGVDGTCYSLSVALALERDVSLGVL